MKKIVAIMLTLVMSMAMVAGCGSDGSAGDQGGSNDASKESGSGAGVLKVIDVDLSDEQYAFGVDKDQTDLLEEANAFIKEIKENGEFDKICNRYFGDGEPEPVESAVEDSSKDQLVVATNAGFEPFEYMKGDKYLGIDMEIAKAFAEKLGKELVIANMDFDAVCRSVGQHKSDIAMAGLTVKPEREEFVTFSNSYYEASQKLIVRSDNTEFDGCADGAAVAAILTGKDSSDFDLEDIFE